MMTKFKFQPQNVPGSFSIFPLGAMKAVTLGGHCFVRPKCLFSLLFCELLPDLPVTLLPTRVRHSGFLLLTKRHDCLTIQRPVCFLNYLLSCVICNVSNDAPSSLPPLPFFLHQRVCAQACPSLCVPGSGSWETLVLEAKSLPQRRGWEHICPCVCAWVSVCSGVGARQFLKGITNIHGLQFVRR